MLQKNQVSKLAQNRGRKSCLVRLSKNDIYQDIKKEEYKNIYNYPLRVD
ncbi:MAG TPA: hypothetical protein VF189_02940 [Patescibacteria group bacterium]